MLTTAEISPTLSHLHSTTTTNKTSSYRKSPLKYCEHTNYSSAAELFIEYRYPKMSEKVTDKTPKSSRRKPSSKTPITSEVCVLGQCDYSEMPDVTSYDKCEESRILETPICARLTLYFLQLFTAPSIML